MEPHNVGGSHPKTLVGVPNTKTLAVLHSELTQARNAVRRIQEALEGKTQTKTLKEDQCVENFSIPECKIATKAEYNPKDIKEDKEPLHEDREPLQKDTGPPQEDTELLQEETKQR